MFIGYSKYGSYYDHYGELHCGRADYLMLAADGECLGSGIVVPKGESFHCSHCGLDFTPMGDALPIHQILPAKLYACVRKVALSQCGQFMMGAAIVGGQSIIVSGPIGNDGLPLDWEDLTDKAKTKFVEVPEDVAAAYWADDGWNGVGKARDVLIEYGKSIR